MAFPRLFCFDARARLVSCAFSVVVLSCSSNSGNDTTNGSGGTSGATSGGAGTTGGSSGASAGGAASGAGGTSNTGGANTGGLGGSSGGGAGGQAGPGSKPWDWVGVIGTGQSLSVGWSSTALSTTQPFKNIVLEDDGPDPKYPIDGSSSAVWKTVPLIEPPRKAVAGTGAGYDDWQYPNNIAHQDAIYGETPHSGMANTLSAVWQARGGDGDYITAHSIVGWSGHTLLNLNKAGGMRAYPASLSETTVFKTLAAAAGKTYGVGGIILTHGEGDATNPDYGTGLWQFWQDYNADIKTITGQERDIVLLASQPSNNPSYDYSGVQMWKAGVDHPGQIVCTGPKYQFGPYGLHLSGPGYERLGEKYGEIFDLIVNQGIAWKPLGPNKVTRSGAVITIDFDVPNPPLVWDENLVAPHQSVHTAWAAGHGFEVIDDSLNEIAIQSAEIVDNSVVLTLTSDPGSKKLTLAYAITADAAGDQGGNDTGAHGQLRDSDSFVGVDSETIELNVANGSANMGEVTPGSIGRRTFWDVVTGDNIAAGTVIKTLGGTQVTLSAPWSGSTGTASLTFAHDQHNYCVHFNMPVP
ncbi:MAG TPA: dockerin [Polyangiaceae bacterium]|nr:dockerin [Polyangiaceae bacterium]